MLKTVKGKIVSGAIAVALVSGAGVAFADTDAGGKLASWYNAHFASKSTEVAGAVGVYGTQAANKAGKDYSTTKSYSLNDIKSQGNTSTNAANKAINDKKEALVGQVKGTKDSISTSMAAQFDKISSDANKLINATGDSALKYAQKDLKNSTGSTGTKALNDLNTAITSTTDAAKSELQTAIDTAKSELTAQLNAEATATTAEIKAAIDAKVLELQGLINAKAAELAQAQKDLIVAKAAELQGKAEADLDAIVDSIN